jgi:hypothetical protein
VCAAFRRYNDGDRVAEQEGDLADLKVGPYTSALYVGSIPELTCVGYS